MAEAQIILRVRDLAQHQLPTVVLSRLVAAGKLERVARGAYSLPGRSMNEFRSLAEVAMRSPLGVVCLLSALRFHGIGTQAPFEIWLAIPHSAHVPRLKQIGVHAIRMSDISLSEGVEIIEVDGIKVSVFNAAKTVADCFKYRNKIGLDAAMEALHEAWFHRKVTMDLLFHYATVNRVAKVMRPYMESAAAQIRY